MKKTITMALVLMSVNGALASPREQYLMDKLKEARRVELQAKSKYLAEKGRYKAVADYRDSIEDQLKAQRKKEAKADKQARKAMRAAYLAVDDIIEDEMTAPTSVKWRTY